MRFANFFCVEPFSANFARPIAEWKCLSTFELLAVFEWISAFLAVHHFATKYVFVFCTLELEGFRLPGECSFAR